MGLILGAGFSLGRAVFSSRVKPHERLPSALIALALATVPIVSLAAVSVPVGFVVIGIGGVMALVSAGLMVFRGPGDEAQ